ncbi:MAG TPA: hypothetical protein VF591_09675 [Pyrinomonadaceae bacterium]|jgi:hypothetical protein
METHALTTETDALPLPFPRAEGEAGRERLLTLLFEEHAASVVRGVVKSKLRVSPKPSRSATASKARVRYLLTHQADFARSRGLLRAAPHSKGGP